MTWFLLLFTVVDVVCEFGLSCLLGLWQRVLLQSITHLQFWGRGPFLTLSSSIVCYYLECEQYIYIYIYRRFFLEDSDKYQHPSVGVCRVQQYGCWTLYKLRLECGYTNYTLTFKYGFYFTNVKIGDIKWISASGKPNPVEYIILCSLFKQNNKK